MGRKKTLFVFDFDYTLIDDNSDTFIMSLCPQLNLRRDLESKRKEFGSWTKFMDHVLSLIHREGCTKDHVLQHMRRVRLYDQALKGVRAVHECEDVDSIILSDANTVFIDTILEECGVRDCFNDVISNPAHFDEGERLCVWEYHSHECDLCKCTPNLCKGRAVEEYRRDHVDYDRVVYVGDGRNDYCPCSRLTEDDVVLCREGYALAKILKDGSPCKAQVHTLDFVSSLGDFITSNVLRQK